MEGRVIDGRWALTDTVLGFGSFGQIMLAHSVLDNTAVAVKLESRQHKHVLHYEYKLYQLLSGYYGIPKFYYYGSLSKNNKRKCLVMEHCGVSLISKVKGCGGRVALSVTLLVADMMLHRLQFIHSKGYVHRDIKPDNMMIHNNALRLIDFGLAKKYFDVGSQRHIPFSDGKSLTGTARYASINTHVGNEQSRRDDLESLCYVLIYITMGRLPWQGLVDNSKGATKDTKYKKVADMKFSTSISALCEGLPECFSQALTYCRGLAFEEKPDYDLLRGLFRAEWKAQGFEWNGEFDFSVKESTDTQTTDSTRESAMAVAGSSFVRSNHQQGAMADSDKRQPAAVAVPANNATTGAASKSSGCAENAAAEEGLVTRSTFTRF